MLAETLAALNEQMSSVAAGDATVLSIAGARWRRRPRRRRGGVDDERGGHRGVTAGIDDDGALLVRVGPQDRADRCGSGAVSWDASGETDHAASDRRRQHQRHHRRVRRRSPRPQLALAALRERTADELGIFVTRLFEQTKVDDRAAGIGLSSVVPPLTRPMEEMCGALFRPAGAARRSATNAGMPVRYSPPTDVGADRIVNAVAACEKYGGRRQASR